MRFAALAGVALLALAGAARELPTVSPDRVGLSAERLARIGEVTQGYVDDGKLAGVLTMVARDGRIAYVSTVGQRGVDDDRPLTEDALFRIYSMTKPITAVAAMILYEEGKFQLSDPVAKFVPELAELDVLVDGRRRPAQNEMTMQQLLTHTAGLSYGFNAENDAVDRLYQEANILRAEDLDAFVGALAKLPLKYEPGTQCHYSVAVDVTGVVVERISGQSFDVFLQERLFNPLDMPDTFFNVPAEKTDRFLPNHGWDAENEKLVAFDDSAFSNYVDTKFFSGGGGLVSTARDYMRFAEMMRNGGELDGVRILGPKTVEFMAMDHVPASVNAGVGERPTLSLVGEGMGGFGFGLGFGVVRDTPAVGVIGSQGEYNWGGAAGTLFWIDPVEEIVVVSMIQLMGSPWELREQLKVLTYQAIEDLK